MMTLDAFIREKNPMFSSSLIEKEGACVGYIAHNVGNLVVVTQFTEHKRGPLRQEFKAVHAGTEMSAKSYIYAQMQTADRQRRYAELTGKAPSVTFREFDKGFLTLPPVEDDIPDAALIRTFSQPEETARKASVHSSWALKHSS